VRLTLLRGGVHQAAYALALEKLTGVNMTRMLPVPNIDHAKFEHTWPWETKGEHTRLYTFSPEFATARDKGDAGASIFSRRCVDRVSPSFAH
jgi:Mn-containing catalase